jgi:hypothetical protein
VQLTQHDMDIVALLAELCVNLQADRLVGSNAAHCRLLSGGKAQGARYRLDQLVELCEAAFPDVIPVYVSLHECPASTGCLARRQSLCDTVVKELRRRGLVDESELAAVQKTSVPVVEAVLRRGNKRLLLLVDDDEADCPSGPRQHASVVLEEVSAIASSDSGKIGAVITGRAVTAPSFKTCCNVEDIFRLFSSRRDVEGP